MGDTLLYTVAFDQPESNLNRLMAKMLVNSLLRTYFSGKILVFRNGPKPLFRLEQREVAEIEVPEGDLPWEGWQARSVYFKMAARKFIDPTGFSNVIFMDADCLALRNIDHLFGGEGWDIRYQMEPNRTIAGPYGEGFNAYFTDSDLSKWKNREGVNGGTWAIRAGLFHQIMQEWEQIDELPTHRVKYAKEQPAWNRLILDSRLRTQRFERDEIQFPGLEGGTLPKDYLGAALVHANGMNQAQKLEFLTGLYYARFMSDPRMHLIEASNP